jgi:hypothetical protein
VTFSEDASHACTGSLPRVMASLRNLAIGALRLAGIPTSPQRYDIPVATRPGHSPSLAWHTHEANIAPPWPRPWTKRGS